MKKHLLNLPYSFNRIYFERRALQQPARARGGRATCHVPSSCHVARYDTLKAHIRGGKIFDPRNAFQYNSIFSAAVLRCFVFYSNLRRRKWSNLEISSAHGRGARAAKASADPSICTPIVCLIRCQAGARPARHGRTGARKWSRDFWLNSRRGEVKLTASRVFFPNPSNFLESRFYLKICRDRGLPSQPI